MRFRDLSSTVSALVMLGLLFAAAALAETAPMPAVVAAPSTRPVHATPDIAKKPWQHNFAPKRQLYVAPNGTGSGATKEAPMSLADAVSKGQPGDVYWLMAGNYKATEKGLLALTSNGEPDAPIVYRAIPGERVTFSGILKMIGRYNWIWGLEVIDPSYGTQGSGDDLSIDAHAPGCHIINNILHNSGGGIGGWDTGPDHVYYGNIIYGMGGDENPPERRTNYPTYTQNSYFTHGYKFWVQNMFMDGRPFPSINFNFHGYTTTGDISGFFLYQNYFDNARFLIGGVGGEPPHHNVVIDNYFYRTPQVQFGYKRPIQVEFRNNYLVRSPLTAEWIWGDGEARYVDLTTLPSIFTGNTILLPPGGQHVSFRTSAYPAVDKRSEGGQAIRAGDVFDGNRYSAPFKGHLFAKGTESSALTLDAWRSASAAAGKAFDAKASEIPVPTEPKVAVQPNDYEPGRAHILIFNWAKTKKVAVDLSSVLKPGDRYQIHPVKKTFDAPLLTGTWSGGKVDVPIGDQEFAAFLLRSAPDHAAAKP